MNSATAWTRSPLVRCLAPTVLCPMASAEVIEPEGTIKSIGPDARSMAITRQNHKGEKVLELRIARKAGNRSPLE